MTHNQIIANVFDTHVPQVGSHVTLFPQAGKHKVYRVLLVDASYKEVGEVPYHKVGNYTLDVVRVAVVPVESREV